MTHQEATQAIDRLEELVRFFGGKLGHIKRIKKGNTYLLRMPGEGDQLG